jgi:hypothetical protein
MNDTFDQDPFDSVTQEADVVKLKRAMRQFEKEHFSGVAPVADLEVVDLDGPARLLTKSRTIQINPSVSNYPRVARVLILHELINHKLFLKLQRAATEEEIQGEVNRLWMAGAYRGLL